MEIKLTDATYVKLRTTIYDLCGIYFDNSQKEIVKTRISKRLDILNLKSYEEYIKIISSGVEKYEINSLFDEITENETYFFRAENQFLALEKVILKDIIKNKKIKTIRIWSAAASSGEEPYTIAMIIEEKLKKSFPDVNFVIVASDISSKMIERAKTGIYSEKSLKNLPSEYLDKYFTKLEDDYKLSQKIKSMVNFQNINLIDSSEFKKLKNFDVIFCANVLMYFDEKLKEKVVSDFYNKLNVGGCLFVGYTESLHSISKSFRLVHYPRAMAYKKEYY